MNYSKNPTNADTARTHATQLTTELLFSGFSAFVRQCPRLSDVRLLLFRSSA